MIFFFRQRRRVQKSVSSLILREATTVVLLEIDCAIASPGQKKCNSLYFEPDGYAFF